MIYCFFSDSSSIRETCVILDNPHNVWRNVESSVAVAVEEHELFSLRDMKPASLPATTAQDCSIRKNNDFWYLNAGAKRKRFWKAIIHVCKQSFDALGAVWTTSRDNVSRDLLDSTRSNKTFVQCQTIFHIRNSNKNLFLLVSWRSVDILVVEVETPTCCTTAVRINLSFVLKTILLFFAAYFFPMCTAFLFQHSDVHQTTFAM